MNFVINNWQLILIALTSGGLLLWPLIKEPSNGLTAHNAVQLINRAKATLIDVSDAEEFSAIHAKGAKNIPLKDLEAKLGTTCKNKALPLIFICPQGKRSVTAVKLAKKMGYPDSIALMGGLRTWREANLPVEKSAS